MRPKITVAALSLLVLFMSGVASVVTAPDDIVIDAQKRLGEYASVALTTDLTKLTDKEKQMIPILIQVADIMDEIFWIEVFGDKNALMGDIKDESVRKLAVVNYGPWDRLDNNRSFVGGFSERPISDNYYPKDMTKEEFNKFGDPNKNSRYTLIGRDVNGVLKSIWYHEAFKVQVEKASTLLVKAAGLAEDPGLKKYLILKASALLSDDYEPSDRAWMGLKNAGMDFIVGPSEVGDRLFSVKTSHEAIVLVKDREWSAKLARYIVLLPKLQKDLPVGHEYKKTSVSSVSDMSAFDAVYCTGDANCASKTVAICLPSDENLRLKTGARRFLLKNVIKAKYDNIVVPLANGLIDSSQQKHVRFEAFFNNLMFLIMSEVAYGPGTPQTINGKGSVRDALGAADEPFVEGKASVMGLFFMTKLIEQGVITDCSVEDAFVAYTVNLLRSIRRGTESPAGKADMMCFNYLSESGAVSRNSEGKYKVDCAIMKTVVSSWLKTIIELQGNGDNETAAKLLKEKTSMSPELQKDLDKLKSFNIPKDVVYKQGLEVLGLNNK